MWTNHRNFAAAVAFLLASLSLIAAPSNSIAHAETGVVSAGRAQTSSSTSPTSDSWVYPVASQDVLRDFWSPNSNYSAGHRGIDFAAEEGEPVLAVADGVVRFAGQVGGRGVVSLTLADGFVAEVEPVCASVATGDQVLAGQEVGTICRAGTAHCQDARQIEVSCVHLSARRFSTDYGRGFSYVTPLLFLGAFKPSHLVAIGSLN